MTEYVLVPWNFNIYSISIANVFFQKSASVSDRPECGTGSSCFNYAMRLKVIL